MFLNCRRWIVSLLSNIRKCQLHCHGRCCATEAHGHDRRTLLFSSFQSHPRLSKSVLCSEAKRSFVTVWPGSPSMKTSNQALIVTNYISLYLCNLHCSNLIQALLRSWKLGKATAVPSTHGEVCVGDLSFLAGSILLHLPGLTMSILSSQSTYVLSPSSA